MRRFLPTPITFWLLLTLGACCAQPLRTRAAPPTTPDSPATDSPATDAPATDAPALLRSATSDAVELNASDFEFFEKRIRPILVDHCYECHSGDESDGGLLLDSRDALLIGGDTGPAIVAGKPDASLLLEAIRYDNHQLQMPPQNRLSQRQIAAVEQWISRGAPDPRRSAPAANTPPSAASGDSSTDATSSMTRPPRASAAGMSLEQGQRFWAFQPIARPDVPPIDDAAWVQTPIDAFILEKLRDNGLQPAPPADRRTLIRRVTFDLIGLPPTMEQIEAFVNDTRPDAYQRLVERLLASPQYGVRWGRHWLDVARYADSNGMDENLAYGNAWRYRDYVFDAFNGDKPFDRFLVEQIAGDLLPDANQATKTATGFLVLGAKVLAEPDREKLEMDTIDEQLDSTGKAFLGMTFGCARCHDHKFDPITQADYYALGAIFKGTRTFADSKTGAIKHWNEHVFASDDELEAMKAIDAEIARLNQAAAAFKNKSMDKLRQQAESLATEYLIAAIDVDLEMPLNQVDQIAGPLGLHARVLHHCRRHLHFHRDDPFFQAWHELARQGDAGGVDSHYRPLFTQATQQASDDEDATVKVARAALHDKSGFLTIPAKPDFAFDADTFAEYGRLMEAARKVESAAPDLPGAMGVADREVAPSLPIHIRGSHLNLGNSVPRGFPAVMLTRTTPSASSDSASSDPASSELASAVSLATERESMEVAGSTDLASREPEFPADQSGRLQLARWLASPSHPLTARVYVNRIWRWHFGAGIVKSTDNFGVLGDRPSHPELLDWLAGAFVRDGLSTKRLHRLILFSSTYQMSSSHPDAARYRSIDPENRWRWRFSLQRLEAEQIRDAILAVAGRLETTLRGKTVPLRNRQFVFNHTSVDHTKYDSLRRAAYLPVIRNNLYTVFEQFDFPDPTMPTGNRHTTTVAPQALLLMNSDWVMESADTIAQQLLGESSSDASRVATAYQRILGRSPIETETIQALEFLNQGAGRRQRRWRLFCHGLLASNEFMYLK